MLKTFKDVQHRAKSKQYPALCNNPVTFPLVNGLHAGLISHSQRPQNLKQNKQTVDELAVETLSIHTSLTAASLLCSFI